MARPFKSGFDFFSLDTTFSDRKVDLLEVDTGLIGFAVLIKLWQLIYGDKGYYIDFDEKNKKLFCKDNSLDREQLDKILNSCFGNELFDIDKYKKYSILTSKGIQSRYLEMCKVTKRKNVFFVKEFLLKTVNSELTRVITEFTNINSEIIGVNSELSTQTETETETETETIEKEKIFLGKSDKFIEAFKEFRKMRNGMRAKMTSNAERLIIQKLEKLSSDEEEQIAILEQSIANSYRGVFPLKKDTKKSKSSNFNKFTQRNYDMDDLENKLLGWEKNKK